MQFTSIAEYFYKFYSRLLLIVMVPVFAFTYVYLRLFQSNALPEEEQSRIIVVAATATGWLILLLFFDKRIKSLRSAQGLRDKLEKYFRLTIVRYTVFSTVSLALATAFLVYRDDLFTMLFVFQLALCAYFWPTSSRVCRDLKLRGDEYEMVYYKKDSF